MRITLITLSVLIVRSSAHTRKVAQMPQSMHMFKDLLYCAFRAKEKKVITVCDWLVIPHDYLRVYACQFTVEHGRTVHH